MQYVKDICVMVKRQSHLQNLVLCFFFKKKKGKLEITLLQWIEKWVSDYSNFSSKFS